ncbi:MAG TPA: hypothetical protein VM493_01895 [Vicinamibacterales bacterium]|nr:hypothetical protein [Vicinamibacterales bacterium]
MTRFTQLGAMALLVLAGAAAPAYSQVASATQDAKAAEVLAKTRKALGDKKLEGLKTLSAQAQMDRNLGSVQASSEVELLVEMPDKYVRAEASRGMGGMTMSTGFNGDKAILPGGGNVSMGTGGAMVFRMGPGGAMHGEGTKPTPEQLAQINTASLKTSRAEVSRMMLGWFGAAHPSLQAKYTYAGEAESPDGKAHVIDVKDGDGFEARLFIDQNNFLPLMVTYKGRQPRMMTTGGPMTRTVPSSGAPGKELTEEDRKKLAADAEKMLTQQMAEQPLSDFSLFFEDWQQVDGLTFPHKMRRAVAGETTEEWTFSKVKVNPKIDPAKFATDAK